jgi:hypothetical protein
VTQPNFDIKVLNQLLVIWLIQYSLSWNCVEDFMLTCAFNYVQRGTTIYSRTWAANKAHQLYINLQSNVISTLKVCFFLSCMFSTVNLADCAYHYEFQSVRSKITLIHDVWTTKGNRHAFFGHISFLHYRRLDLQDIASWNQVYFFNSPGKVIVNTFC